MQRKIVILVCLSCLSIVLLQAQTASSFELRYFMPDVRANGETDFKGETSVFTTDQRIDFLKQYAAVAGKRFDDPWMNTIVVDEYEAMETLVQIKPQPLPDIRKRKVLSEWKFTGYREGQESEREAQLLRWRQEPAAEVKEGRLVITNADEPVVWKFASQAWRFHLSWMACPSTNSREIKFALSDKQQIPAATVGFGANGALFYTTAQGERRDTLGYQAGKWYRFRLEVDLCGSDGEVGRYNLYVNDQLVADFVPIERAIPREKVYSFSSLGQVNTFAVHCDSEVVLDNVCGIGYALTNRPRYPYAPEILLDETFDGKPAMEHWTELSYDDSQWENGDLPLVHGSLRHHGEDLYLRKKVYLDRFEQVYLNLETLDPGGEIWINGQHVLSVHDRYPYRIDVTPYLRAGAENLLAIKVNHFYLTKDQGELMVHSSLDLNVGWFAGRMSLDLVQPTYIEGAYAHALPLKGRDAVLKTKLLLQSPGPFDGKATIEIFPWFPEESKKAVGRKTIRLSFNEEAEVFEQIAVKNPVLWTPEHPALYKVKVALYDNTGKAVDDYVFTTGIRTVDQEGGMFRLNGKVSMLNGGQIMGYRSPLDEAVVWNRCPPPEWLIKELLMVKKMNGNLLRIHVHAWESSLSEGINDPRIAEFADQLGIMLIWTTPSWIRTGWDWRQIDFKGLPLYMKQVYNHPSIVLWEASNHPNTFKQHGVEDSDAFCETVYNTIYPVDSSRIISFTSYIKHMHYGNDAGTVDYQGNPMKATWAYTAPMVTRGNQDAPTGYSHAWSALRKWDNDYMKDMLNSPDRAYFNFEHQESMAQPNWSLLKGKPYYRMHSYEWNYDEGTIGRRLTLDEWKESQAYQAFAAWEAIKKMRFMDYDGFSWCTLHGGPNSGTYHKPLIDMHGHAKLAYWTNKMAFQPTVAGSRNVDVVYGPDDELIPVIIHWGNAGKATLTVTVKSLDDTIVDVKSYTNIELPQGRQPVSLPSFKPAWSEEGCYVIEYQVNY